MKAASVGVNSCMQRAMTLELEAAQSSCATVPRKPCWIHITCRPTTATCVSLVRHTAKTVTEEATSHKQSCGTRSKPSQTEEATLHKCDENHHRQALLSAGLVVVFRSQLV